MALLDAISSLYSEKAEAAIEEALSGVSSLKLSKEESDVLCAAITESVKSAHESEAGRITIACEKALTRAAAGLVTPDGEPIVGEPVAAEDEPVAEKKKRGKK